jgi:hypothetical protein
LLQGAGCGVREAGFLRACCGLFEGNLQMIRIFTDQTAFQAAFGLLILSLFVLFQAFFRTFAPESIVRNSFSGANSIFFAKKRLICTKSYRPNSDKSPI